jgi:hypothetical protein
VEDVIAVLMMANRLAKLRDALRRIGCDQRSRERT